MIHIKKTDTFLLWLLLMTLRIVFLFVDAFSYKHIVYADAHKNSPTPEIHASAPQNNIPSPSILDKKIPQDRFGIQEDLLYNKTQEEVSRDLHMDSGAILKNKIKQIQSNNSMSILEDIKILEQLYNKQKNPLVLKALIDKLTQDYQFDKAKKYMDLEMANAGEESVDQRLYFYVLINSSDVSVMKNSSIDILQPQLEETRIKWLLSTDDYRFYQALSKLRYNDYSGAQALFDEIISPRYSGFINKLHTIHTQVSQQRDVPAYYEHSLIALNLLKHGYFSIAKRISLQVLEENDKYILPYQILAYSHFLTNDWTTAIDYLLKLSDFDQKNQLLYKFLVGVSYYRLDKYEPSLLYLSQIEQASLQGDTDLPSHSLLSDSYRYMLLDYIAMDDSERMMNTWKKFLGQVDLQKSDFYTFFYEVLYKPFVDGGGYKLYQTDPQLVQDYVNRCETVLIKTDEDVCTYGQAWLSLVLWQKDQAKHALLYLAKNYPQSYIFHSLWDYYYQIGEESKAKQYYIKAISMPHNNYEESTLKTKLTDFASTIAK